MDDGGGDGDDGDDGDGDDGGGDMIVIVTEVEF